MNRPNIMDYKIPSDIKNLCAKDNLSDPDEQEKVKREIVKYLKLYLDLKVGRNSLANVTDIVKDVFEVKGTVYPFERDIAGRMMRTRNYTMQEGTNEAGNKDVIVIAADRDWWDKYKLLYSIVIILIGAMLGSIFSPITKYVNNQINSTIDKDYYRIELHRKPSIIELDSVEYIEIQTVDSLQN